MRYAAISTYPDLVLTIPKPRWRRFWALMGSRLDHWAQVCKYHSV